MSSAQEQGYYERQQTHLHKLAMILCVSRGGFPNIEVQDLVRADEALRILEPDVKEVFGNIGQTRIASAAGAMLDAIRKLGPIHKTALYHQLFFRSMSSDEFNVALNSVKATGMIVETGALSDPLLAMKETT